MNLAHLLLVAMGGALGAAGRHMVNLAVLRLAGPSFPWGTLAVNVTGSFIMGLLAGGIARWLPDGGGQSVRLFLGVGLLGGFTTFSAFSLDVAALWQRGEAWLAAGYVASSVLLSVAALFLGLGLTRGGVS